MLTLRVEIEYSLLFVLCQLYIADVAIYTALPDSGKRELAMTHKPARNHSSISLLVGALKCHGNFKC